MVRFPASRKFRKASDADTVGRRSLLNRQPSQFKSNLSKDLRDDGDTSTAASGLSLAIWRLKKGQDAMFDNDESYIHDFFHKHSPSRPQDHDIPITLEFS